MYMKMDMNRMYSIRKVWLVLAGIVFLPLMAEATPANLSIEDFSIHAGETKELVIDLSNPDDEITLVQFDMRLPEGLSIAKEDGDYAIDIAGRTTWKKHSLSANVLDGVTRFLLASNTNAVISGTEGAIITVKLVAEDNFDGGDIKLENILLVTPQQKETKPNAYVYTIVPYDTTLAGDANGDGTVNAIDIADIVNYLMGKPTSTGKFKKDAADVNGDETVNVADILKIVNIIMGNVEPGWINVGTGTITDNFWFESSAAVTILKDIKNPNVFRIMAPFEGLAKASGASLDGNQDSYIELTLLKPGDTFYDVEITQHDLVGYNDICTGYYHTNYEADVYMLYPGCFTSMCSEEFFLNNCVVEWQNNGLPGRIQLAPYFYMFGVGGWNYTKEENVVTIDFPGWQ